MNLFFSRGTSFYILDQKMPRRMPFFTLASYTVTKLLADRWFSFSTKRRRPAEVAQDQILANCNFCNAHAAPSSKCW